MPRVSEEHLATRRAEILGAAARCFARRGFQATSMDDISEEAGVSAGLLYRYFKSKDELVRAVIGLNLSASEDAFAALLADDAAPSPLETLTFLVNFVAGRAASPEVVAAEGVRLVPHGWSEALLDPEAGRRMEQAQRRFREQFAEVARRWRNAGHLQPDIDPEYVGTVLLGIVHGFLIQRLLVPDTTAEDYLGGVQALLTPAS